MNGPLSVLRIFLLPVRPHFSPFMRTTVVYVCSLYSVKRGKRDDLVQWTALTFVLLNDIDNLANQKIDHGSSCSKTPPFILTKLLLEENRLYPNKGHIWSTIRGGSLMKKFFYIKLYVRRHYCAKIPPYRLLFGPTSIPPPPQIDQIFMGSLLQKSPY